MKRGLAHLTIRVKLTIGFLVAMSLVLGATGAFLYVRFAGELNHAIDRGLRSQVDSVRTLIGQTDTGLRDSGRGLVAQGRSFAQVLYDGRVVDFTVPLSRPLLDAATLTRATRGAITVERVSVPGVHTPVRLRAAPVTGQDGRQELAIVGMAVADRNHALSVLAALLAAGGAGALLLAGAVGYGLSTLTLRTVESMRRRAGGLSLTDPGARLPVPQARDELWRLATTLNAMLARNEAAFARERAFVADASHELRTPLSILHAELELALRAGNSPAEIRRAMASAVEESERLSHLADDLLVVARSDHGELSVNGAPHPVGELLAHVVQRFAARASDQGRPLRAEPTSPDLSLDGDGAWIERALDNLVDNALRHGAGAIVLSSQAVAGGVELHVRDDGVGFAPDFLPAAFERFSRAPRSRSQEGSGVGLAVVRSIAHAHGGEAHARNHPDGGADVWLTLPGQPRERADVHPRGQMNAR
jgi:two-component system OmpR family sensor kinase